MLSTQTVQPTVANIIFQLEAALKANDKTAVLEVMQMGSDTPDPDKIRPVHPVVVTGTDTEIGDLPKSTLIGLVNNSGTERKLIDSHDDRPSHKKKIAVAKAKRDTKKLSKAGVCRALIVECSGLKTAEAILELLKAYPDSAELGIKDDKTEIVNIKWYFADCKKKGLIPSN